MDGELAFSMLFINIVIMLSKLFYRWAVSLCDTLLKEITDNPEIKQGLYPGPGTVGRDDDGNTITKSNVLRKADYQYMLAEAVFGMLIPRTVRSVHTGPGRSKANLKSTYLNIIPYSF